MDLKSNGWFIDAEIMIQAKKMNLKIGEIPTVFHRMKFRPSFIKFRSVWEFFYVLRFFQFCVNFFLKNAKVCCKYFGICSIVFVIYVLV